MPGRTTTLARLPTPIAWLPRLSAWVGAEVWIKRDDLTGLELSGNKVRKLEYLLADAVARGCDTVLTTGGIQSNHCRATAAAARQLGLRPVLLLRGERPRVSEGNLLLDDLYGAEIHWCTAEEYRTRRDARLSALANEMTHDGRVPYVIPEGGSNGLGALGYAAAAEEVVIQGAERFDSVVVALGSGGTVAGLLLGPHLGPVRAVAVCDDRAYFEPRIHAIAAQARPLGKGPIRPHGDGWEIVEGYQGPAYGVAGPEVWRTIAQVARLEGILLDPVYTGKAMHALVDSVRSGRFAGRILFWHTGGAFGLFGRGAEIPKEST